MNKLLCRSTPLLTELENEYARCRPWWLPRHHWVLALCRRDREAPRYGKARDANPQEIFDQSRILVMIMMI